VPVSLASTELPTQSNANPVLSVCSQNISKSYERIEICSFLPVVVESEYCFRFPKLWNAESVESLLHGVIVDLV
jgi:hypothetical protein